MIYIVNLSFEKVGIFLSFLYKAFILSVCQSVHNLKTTYKVLSIATKVSCHDHIDLHLWLSPPIVHLPPPVIPVAVTPALVANVCLNLSTLHRFRSTRLVKRIFFGLKLY